MKLRTFLLICFSVFGCLCVAVHSESQNGLPWGYTGQALTLPSGINTQWEADCITYSGGMCSTPANGTTSFTWDDESGNADNLTQNSGTCTFNTNQTPSGKPAVNFSSCHFNASSSFGLDSGAGGTEFIVFKSNQTTSQGVFMGSGSQSGSKPEFYFSGGSVMMGVNSQGVSVQGVDSASTSTNWNNANVTLPPYPDATDWIFRLNEAADACSSHCNTAVNWGSSFNSVGWEGISTDPAFAGQIAAIITYRAVLSTTQKQAVENYLKAKYGI